MSRPLYWGSELRAGQGKVTSDPRRHAEVVGYRGACASSHQPCREHGCPKVLLIQQALPIRCAKIVVGGNKREAERRERARQLDDALSQLLAPRWESGRRRKMHVRREVGRPPRKREQRHEPRCQRNIARRVVRRAAASIRAVRMIHRSCLL